jgi:chromosome segregation ATPase
MLERNRRSMAITKEQVADAAAAIQGEGLEPTYINVRERLGSGSFSTIQKYLKDWRSSGAEIKPEAEGELPEPFREVLQRFGLEAWRAVSVWAKDELEEARKDFERRVAENQAEAEKAAATVDALQVELNSLGEERDSLRREVEEAHSKLAAAEGALSETRKQVEREIERNQALERRNQEELAAAGKDFERRLAEHQSEIDKVAKTVDALQAELDKVREERESFRREAEGARANLSAAQGTLGEARRQIEREIERSTALERRNQELSERVIEESAKAKALELGAGKRSN